MQKCAGWKIRMLMPCVHHGFKIKKSGWEFAKGVEITERDGIEIWFGYYPYYLPRNPTHAKIHFGEKMFLQYMEKHGKPDFLWVQSIPGAGDLARHLRRKYDIPYFVHEHRTTYMTKKLRPSVCLRIGEVIRGSTYCTAVSEWLRRDMLRQIPVAAAQIGVIHNPVGLIFADSAPAPRKQNPFTFISTAYLRSIKNIDKIICAFAEVHADFSDSRLLLVGDGEMKTALKNLVKELRLSDVVVFTGMQNREQLCEHLQKSDAFVAAAQHESFGVALAEALACGLPAITPAVGIAGEAVNNANGVLVDSPSVENIAAAMRWVMNENYDSAAIQQAARQQFSPEIFAHRIQEVLNSGGGCYNPPNSEFVPLAKTGE